MNNLGMKDTLNILGTGIGASLLVFLIIQVGFAQTLDDFVLDHISDDYALSLIIFGLLSIAFIASIAAGILLPQFISELSVLYASFLAYYASFVFLIFISYSFMFLQFKYVFSQVHGFEIILIFPQVIIAFALYVLGEIIALFIISMVSYYLFFILFLDKFYIVKVQVK